MSARMRTVGLGPSSYSSGYQTPTGAGSMPAQPAASFTAGGGTPEGRALIVLVIVELILTGWLRVIFKTHHGG